MKVLEWVFWFIWIVLIIFITLTFPIYDIYEAILFLLFFLLVGIIMYFQTRNVRQQRRLAIMIKNINFRPLEEEIKKIEERHKESMLRVFSLERKLGDFDNYKIEQEKKYREIVRKVLDVDNEVNRKYKLLGETLIKLSKDIKK